MHFNLAFSALIGLAAASPFKFPLANGFPNPSNESLAVINQQAGGSLSNAPAPPPASVADDTLTSMKLIAFNELFETAFFTQLYQNVSNNAPGYELGAAEKEGVLATLKAVIAQEELHTLNANGFLRRSNVAEIQPCEYQFPVATFKDAIALAATFTDVVLGTLQDVSFRAANTSGAQGAGIARAVASVIGQEGEQNGFYRALQLKRPSAQPFLTTSIRDFAFTALLGFTVPGSCPNANTIPLKQFNSLTITTPTKDIKDGELAFSVGPANGQTLSSDKHTLAYISGQNVPVIVPIETTGPNTFKAAFPAKQNLFNGLTIAVVIEGPLASSAQQVADKAVWAPGLIEFDATC